MRRRTTGPLQHAAGEAVRNYLDGLRAPRPVAVRSPGNALRDRLSRIEFELATAPPMRELKLVQERHDILEALAWQAREDAFVDVARTYGRRNGISFATWRAVGVPAAVLRRAGVRPPPSARVARRPPPA